MYLYDGCGLPNVYLRNGYQVVDTPYGKGVTIHDIPGLHRAIGLTIACSPQPMSGGEFRFLRQELDLSQTALASLIGCDPQSVARWENGKSKRIDPASERVLRIIFRETAKDTTESRRILELLRQPAQPVPRKFVAHEKSEKWSAAEQRIA